MLTMRTGEIITISGGSSQ